jgi:hypothetical protein
VSAQQDRAEARRVAAQVDLARPYPVVVTRAHRLPRDTWKEVLRAEAAAAVTRYLTEAGGLPEEVCLRAGKLAAEDQLRGYGATRVFLDRDQLAAYARLAAEEAR